MKRKLNLSPSALSGHWIEANSYRASERNLPDLSRPVGGLWAEVCNQKAEVEEGAGEGAECCLRKAATWREKVEGAEEGAEGVSTHVFHRFWVLLLAISAHVFNGL